MLPNAFGREDPSDDALFYATPRKVVHLEEGAIEALRSAYAELLPAGAPILDLMSSWRSHLPEGLGPVTGLGMNEEEMAENPQLSGYVVHDLNRSPLLPLPDRYFAAAVCSLSIQYLIHPVLVFSEVLRVLHPGAPVVVSFSNRCFPTKAVAVWRAGDESDRRQIVRTYVEGAGFEHVVDRQLASPDDPLFLVSGRRPA